MRRTGLMWVTATVIIVISGCSKTERAKPPSSEQPTGYSGAGTGGAGANVRSDDDFVHDVAVKTMAAVELSRMALDKATDPAQPDEKRRKTAEELKNNRGGNFDRDYVEAMVEGHQYSPSRCRRAALGVRTTRHSRPTQETHKKWRTASAPNA